MILEDIETWPAPIVEYLSSQHATLLNHARHDRKVMDAYLHPTGKHVPMAMMPSNPYAHLREGISHGVLGLARAATLRGWHCTRLTDDEIAHVTAHGMQLPNRDVLIDRIRRIEAAGTITANVAKRLIEENQADDNNRRGVLWFCFFEPSLAGQTGIERFFRRWGGEALYNSHESDLETGEALRRIGRPCLIEVDVPVSSFGRYTSLGEKIIRRYLLDRGYDTGESWEHEDRAHAAIPASSIVRFICHGAPEFTMLAGCDSWDPPLDG